MRFAILQLYKLEEHYFPTVQQSAWLASLRADGHDAETAEFVFSADEPEPQQLERLSLALEAAGYDVLFVDRVWSAALRRALGPRLVVALGHPDLLAQGLVDAALTDVCGANLRGIVRALAAGEEPGEQTAWRRQSSDGRIWERRRRPTPLADDLLGQPLDFEHHRVLSPRRSNPEHVVVVANLGCAYRNVANDTGVLDNVPMPDGVTTAGCTFCDAEVYERMAIPDALATLAAQTTAWLHARPEVRTVAVKDDYAVRYLGDLMETLEGAGLDGRDVLLSARPDYLSTYAADIERQLARGVPGRLGFYLLGLENFADAELQRFHKGMDRSQMMAAVALMRRWKTSYPQRFCVSPSAGFILFTPWTTLADLSQNAEAIAALDLEEQRGGLALSRLRLYPNLPLYWLAKRDGLLVTSLEAGNVGDAQRRGYEADHPWRFAHPEVAAIYQQVSEGAATGIDHPTSILLRLLNQAGPAGPLHVPTRNGSVSLKVNDRCNQSCGFCTARLGSDVSTIPQVLVEKRLTQALEKHPHRLLLGGAEPTLEPWLESLVRRASTSGVREVVVETNSTGLDRPRVSALVAAGLTHARVAINSTDAATADAISGGGHAQTLAGVTALHEAGVIVELVVPLLPANVGALAAVAAAARVWLPEQATWLVVGRPVTQSRAAGPVLSTRAVAAEVEAAWTAAPVDVRVQVSAGDEPPPCAFTHPREAARRMGLDPDRARRDASKAQRTPACAACGLAAVCAGVRTAYWQDFQALTRAVPTSAVAAPALDVELGLPATPPAPMPTGSATVPVTRDLTNAPEAGTVTADPPIELVQLHAGLRKLAKMEFAAEADLERIQAHVQTLGLCSRVQPASLLAQSAGIRTLLWVAHGTDAIDEAIRVEEQIRGTSMSSRDAVARMGQLLNFPSCCIDFHAEQAHQDDAGELRRLAAAMPGKLPWPLNWGAFSLRLFGHTPCTPDCPQTRDLAWQTWQALAALNPQAAELRQRRLQSVVIAAHPLAFVLLPGAQSASDRTHIRYVEAETSLAMEPQPDPRTVAWDQQVGAPIRRGDSLQVTAEGLEIRKEGRLLEAIALSRPPMVLDFTGRWP